MQKNNYQDNGFTVIEFIFGIVAIIAIGAAIYFAYNGHKTNVAVSSTPSPKVAVATPNPTATWKSYSVTAGKYSFKYDPTLKVSSGGDFTAGAAFISDRPALLGDGGGARSEIVFYSAVGDIRRDNYGVTEQTMGDRVDKTEDVVLNGVMGKRYEITATKSFEMEPPVVGQTYVVYNFYSNGRTFSAYYTHAPAGKDYSEAFRLMVDTWKF